VAYPIALDVHDGFGVVSSRLDHHSFFGVA
jgi:hypothetical protein